MAVSKEPLTASTASASSSKSELEASKDANKSLAKEVHVLTEDNELLKQAPSPHKVKVITRTEKHQNTVIKEKCEQPVNVSSKPDSQES